MQKLQLSIPEPCHENWQQMTPTEQGRFCNACAKEVIDFSTMTDIQVLNYFTNLTNEKVCGRALPEQLDRTINRPAEPKKKLFWYWNYIVMFFMFFKGNNAAAQSNTKPATEQFNVDVKDFNTLLGKVGEVAVSDKRVITGKVADENGNAIPFASVKIKGTNTATSTDANGTYSMNSHSNAILVISAASFIDTEVPVGRQSVLNTILYKSGTGQIVLTVGGAIARDMDESYSPVDKLKRVAVIQVKDEITGKTIPNASLIIQTRYSSVADSVLTDNKGIYKIKGITESDEYEIKIIANGYEPNEFTIDENDFKDRKKEWNVLLRKKKNIAVKSSSIGKLGNENTIRLGGITAVNKSTEAIYVVDGVIKNSKDADINPDDIEDVTVLKGPEATALFGPEGANGAIVITTRRAKEIKMDEVVVNSEYGTKRHMAGGIGYTSTYTISKLDDTIATVKTVLTDSIKIYPNPVQRNGEFSVELKLKQPGSYSMMITDASGRVVLQQRFNSNAKNHTEKIIADSRWSSGIYYISIIDNKNKLISKKSFIFLIRNGCLLAGQVWVLKFLNNRKEQLAGFFI